MLLEAQTLILLEQINSIRTTLSLPLVTKQELIDSLNTHLADLEPYDWMKEI